MAVKLSVISLVISVITFSLVLTILIIQQLDRRTTTEQEEDELVINTNVGAIRGVRATDGDYTMFLGIPYAKVNETNPFGPSTTYPRFTEVFEAYYDTVMCPQVEETHHTSEQALDCLNLNIYVPRSASSSSPLPVLLWIHGGGFATGDSGRFIYGPKYLVRHDVILASLNYRLGPYGFMCLDTPDFPGNEGLKDQLKGLRWIKDNIGAFGGDANKITLFGESAGAMAVDLHLLSTNEKLYDKLILQSGTSLAPGVLGGSFPALPLLIAARLGLATSDLSEAVAFLSTLNPETVIEASSNLPARACVEKVFDGVENFITDFTVNQRIPKINGIPILLGYNNDEALGYYGHQDPEFFDNQNLINMPINVAFNFEENKTIKMEKNVRRFYMGDEKLSEETKFKIIDFTSDLMFNHPAERTIAKYIFEGAEKVYYYVFSYVGERNIFKNMLNITIGGAAHADELGYLFDVSYITDNPTPGDQLIIDRMTTMWTNFAKYGDPTPVTSHLFPVKWEPITRDSAYNYLNIDSDLSVGTRPFHRRMAFWDLFYKSNRNSIVGITPDSRA